MTNNFPKIGAFHIVPHLAGLLHLPYLEFPMMQHAKTTSYAKMKGKGNYRQRFEGPPLGCWGTARQLRWFKMPCTCLPAAVDVMHEGETVLRFMGSSFRTLHSIATRGSHSYLSALRRGGTRRGRRTLHFLYFVWYWHPRSTVLTQRLRVQTYPDSKAASPPELKPVLVWGERAVVLHEERALGAQQPDRRETMAWLLMLLLGVLLEVCSGVSVNRGGYPSFTDEIPFKITWPGPEFTLVSCLLRKEHVCCQGRVAEMLYHLRSWRCCPPTVLPDAAAKSRNYVFVCGFSADLRGFLQWRGLCHHDNGREGEVQVSPAFADSWGRGRRREDLLSTFRYLDKFVT